MLLSLWLSSSPAVAQTHAAPNATQHALDELANAIAQGKITSTPTPSRVATPSPTATPEPTSVQSTETPGPTSTATPTPEPGLLRPRNDQAVSGYVRPSPRDPSGVWLELALPEGRWAILYDATTCTPPAAWTNVWFAWDDHSDRPTTVERDDASAACAVAQWSWTSDVACAADDQGTCDVQQDAAYWDAIGEMQPGATDTPTPVPAPRTTPSAPPPPTTVALAAPTTAPPAPRTEVAEPTLSAVFTAAPTGTATPVFTATPTGTPTPMNTATSTPNPTRTPTPPATNTPTLEPTQTEVPSISADVSATQLPALQEQADDPARAPEGSSWNWTLTFAVLGLVLGVAAIWLLVIRAGPVMW